MMSHARRNGPFIRLYRREGRLLRIIAAVKADPASPGVWQFPLACASAWLLTFAFPRSNVDWLAPLAFGGLFFAWYAGGLKRAFMVGFASGLVYFGVMFAWFGETVGRLLGPFGFITALGPAAIEALAFAAAAALAAMAFAKVPRSVAPLASAAAFTLLECLRSVGPLGVPFAQIGVSQVDGWLAPLGAFGGVSLVTFAVVVVGAYVAAALLDRRIVRPALFAVAVVAAGTLGAYIAWPARHAGAGTIPVAAIQANIVQEVKWRPETLTAAVQRYVELTKSTAAWRPRLVLWPETVITTPLGDEKTLPPTAARSARDLRKQFAALARTIRTTLVVGALEQSDDGLHNALFVFSPNGALQTVYRKRQLVPFAETLPALHVLGRLPFADLVGRLSPGHDPVVFRADQLAFAPLICWESAFGDLAFDQNARGATLFVIPTDDGWFGHTAGPYQHAQIAQMRAIETGRWVLRAGATGISGIIRPDGHWTVRTALDTVAVVTADVGEPAPTLFSRIGPTPIALLYAIVVVAVFGFACLRRGTRVSGSNER